MPTNKPPRPVACSMICSSSTRHPALGEARLERAALAVEAGDVEAARDDLERLFDQWAEASEGFIPLARARALHDKLD